MQKQEDPFQALPHLPENYDIKLYYRRTIRTGPAKLPLVNEPRYMGPKQNIAFHFTTPTPNKIEKLKHT